MKRYIQKYLIFILGLFFLSMGIVLIVRSTLGTTPISSINYVLSLNTPFSLGTWTFIINMILIVGQFYLIRGRRTKRDVMEIMLQIPFSFLFSAFIDANMYLTQNLVPGNYPTCLTLLLLGCLIQSIGVVLELKPQVAMMSAEAFVRYASTRYHKDFGTFKVCFDVSLITMAAIIGLLLNGEIVGIREGSAISAGITGFVVRYLNLHVMTRRNLHRIARVTKMHHHFR